MDAILKSSPITQTSVRVCSAGVRPRKLQLLALHELQRQVRDNLVRVRVHGRRNVLEIRHLALPCAELSKHVVVSSLVIQPRVVYPDQHSVHSEEEPQQEEEAGGHHSDLHADHRHAVIVQLVLEQQHVLEELNLLSRAQLLRVDALGRGLYLRTSPVRVRSCVPNSTLPCSVSTI